MKISRHRKFIFTSTYKFITISIYYYVMNKEVKFNNNNKSVALILTEQHRWSDFFTERLPTSGLVPRPLTKKAYLG